MPRNVLTTQDLDGVAPGGELSVTPDTLVTPLAREEAERRNITLRVVEPRRGGADRVVAIGADHGGYPLKEELKAYLRAWGYVVLDQGTDSADAVDYPDFAEAVANAVVRGDAGRGIIIDSAGIGSVIAANKVPGARAALCYDRATARNSREHNDANVLSLGAKLISSDVAREIVALWLETPFAGGRHQKRIDKIRAIEAKHGKQGHASRPHPGDGNMASETPSMDQRQLELIISVITDEVLHYLSGAQPSAAGPSDDAVCPDCQGHCIGICAEKTRKGIAAGADRISASDSVQQCEAGIAPYIDHTLLKPEASREQVIKLCQEAVRFGFATVCVNPWYVPLAAEHVRGSAVKVCTVAGFPLGATLPQVKIHEAEEAIKLGAQEVDMVINVGALKSGQDEVVELDVRGVVEACHRGGAICKVILETALLTTEEKVRASVACKNAGADFVKTSTGFGPGGATAEDVALMRAAVGREMGVKAAGGIRSIEDFKKMVSAGATRIGASASVRILEEACGPSKN